jgi:hypothetical protein
MFLAAAIASPVYQDPAHGFGRHSEEVASSVPRLRRLMTDQPQVRLVHQGSGFERLSTLLVGHFLRR